MAKHRFPPGRPDPKDLERFGPRLEIEVGWPNLGKPDVFEVPSSSGNGKFFRMPALIDTGASRTLLTPEAIARLNLPLVDYVSVARTGGIDRVAVYVASIRFPRYHLAPIDLIQVLCAELPNQPLQCLIGRDIFSRWLFTYNGYTGEWSISDEDLAPSLDPPTIYDVSICHASEDKPFVDPLAHALKRAGVSVWYDRDKITWGDDLRGSIDKGLSNSRFGIVIFSKAFFRRKRWTEYELNGLFARDRAGEKVILPIWHEISQGDLAGYSHSFVDRFAMNSQKDSIADIVMSLKSLLRRIS
jgi:predicted aspartyl protease